MDPILYMAAVKCDIDVLMQNKDQLDAQMTPNRNTVLHVAAQFHNNSTCVKEILAIQPSLLRRVNSRGETPLHISAREGHCNVVQALIECAKAAHGEELESGIGMAKEMLRMKNEDGDTALHEAVRNNHLDLVKLLTRQDPEFSHPTNNDEESPLYLAVERGYCNIVSEILRTRLPAYSGPDGRTALHAAAIWNCQECTQILYDWKPQLTKEADKNGWRPLHYAAEFGYELRVKQLLHLDKSVAYHKAEEDERKCTALHIATSAGNVDVMKELLFHCPDCWEIINSRGQNILHIAIDSGKEEAVNFILGNPLYISLINQKDDDGNTPLHIFATSNHYSMSDLVKHPRIDKKAFNKENLTPLDAVAFIHDNIYNIRRRSMEKKLKSAGAVLGGRNVVSKSNAAITERKKARTQYKKEYLKHIKEAANTDLIVAALIATVTFTAGFTVPGGYDDNGGPNQGMAILTREAAFKAFVISNTIAMISSTCAVFIHFIASAYDDHDKFINRAVSATLLIIIAMVAMVIAFITGVYVVLAHSSGLAIATCVIGCFYFPIYYFLLNRFLNDF